MILKVLIILSNGNELAAIKISLSNVPTTFPLVKINLIQVMKVVELNLLF